MDVGEAEIGPLGLLGPPRPRPQSLEQRIYNSKNTYYERLFQSQQGWHSSERMIWPWVSYLASVLSVAYDDFEASVAAARDTVRNKQQRVANTFLNRRDRSFVAAPSSEL